MQKNNGIDFDLQVKAMCEAASEPAPAGAWAAISSRVAGAGASGSAVAGGRLFGQGAASGASRRVWGWTAAALAVAASLLLGIFLFNRSGSPSGVSPRGDDALLAQAEAPAAYPSATAATTAEASDVLAPRQLYATRHSAEETATAEDGLTAKSLNDSELSGFAPREKEEEQNHSTASASSSYQSGTSGTASATQPDPFAQMAAEDARKARSRRPAALFVGGSITDNNASAGAGAYAASGNRTGKGISETSKSTYSIPLSFGLGVRFPLGDRLSLAAGLDYSLLSRTFAGTYTADAAPVNADVRHTVQYIGIPVNIYCSLLDIGGLHLYGFAGAEAEYGISNKYTVYAPDKDIKIKESVSGLQYSAAAGIGIEFRITDKIGLYLDPSARYYFDCRQPKSIRTEKPFLLVFDAGLRFNL